MNPGSTSPSNCSISDTFVDYDAIGRQLQDQAAGQPSGLLRGLLLLPTDTAAAAAAVAVADDKGLGLEAHRMFTSRRELGQAEEVAATAEGGNKPELPTGEFSLHREVHDEVADVATADASDALLAAAATANPTGGKVIEHKAPVPVPTAPGPLPLEVAIAAGVVPPSGALRSKLATAAAGQTLSGVQAAAAAAAGQAVQAAATATPSATLTAIDKAKLAKVSNPAVCKMLLDAFGAPAAQLGNSICNGGPWNTRWCSYDLGDCCTSTCKPDVVRASQTNDVLCLTVQHESTMEISLVLSSVLHQAYPAVFSQPVTICITSHAV